MNALEAAEDAGGRWRAYINDALGDAYAGLFGGFDQLVFLRVPNLAAVRRWRLQQESERPVEQRLGPQRIERFVAHYERLTLWMLEDLPRRADVLVELDEAHRVRAASLDRI